MFLSLVATVSLVSGWSCLEEDRRIVRHLEGVLAQLETSPPAGLSTSQAERRSHALDVLRHYVEAGRFPRWGGGGFLPVFVDAEGTRCAMGEVIFQTGGAALVNRVHATANEARIDQLANDPELLAHLDSIGFTLEEAALVQPQYRRCGPQRVLEVCDNMEDHSRFAPFIVTAVIDGGVPVVESVLRGTPTPLTPWGRLEADGSEGAWPDGTRMMLGALRTSPDFMLIERSGRWMAPSDHRCSEPLMLSDADARRIVRLPFRQCLAELAALDGRWLATTCVAWAPYEQPRDLKLGETICRADGSFRADAVQPRPIFEDWLRRNRLEVEPSRYDVNLPVIERNALETEPLPATSGCASIPHGAAVIALLVLARRRR